MKKILVTLLSLSTFTFTTASFAELSLSDCPPVSLVEAHINFSLAQVVYDDFWILFDQNKYAFKDKNWATTFVGQFPGISSPDTVLEKARESMQNVSLTDPHLFQNSICIYSAEGAKPIIMAMLDTENDLRYKAKQFFAK